MNGITVTELFDYLLKNAGMHKEALERAIEEGMLPDDVRNSAILAKHNDIFADNPDTDIDHLDNVIGDPQEEDITDYTDQSSQEQIADSKIANAVADNIKRGNLVRDLKGIDSALQRYDTDRAMAESLITQNHIDKILENIRRRPDLSDQEKIETALKFIYNMHVSTPYMPPEDIRLSQDDIANALFMSDTPGRTLDDYQKVEPKFMEWSQRKEDKVPLSYISDKDTAANNSSIYSPSSQALTVYNVFANTLIDDIKAGKAPDTDYLSKYITDAYNNKLKTMTYDDWEKQLALESTPLDVDQLIKSIKANTASDIKPTGNDLGDYIIDRVRGIIEKAKEAGTPLNDKAIKGMVLTLLAVNSDEEVPPEALTPEDWVQFIPDNPRLRNKSAEEKADNKLNRWHADEKENYKKYLKAKAKTRDENSPAYLMSQLSHEGAKETILDYIERHYDEAGQELLDAVEKGQDNKTAMLKEKLSNWRDALKAKEEGQSTTYVENWASRLENRAMRKKYNLKDKPKDYAKKSRLKDVIFGVERTLNDDEAPPTPDSLKYMEKYLQSAVDAYGDLQKESKEEQTLKKELGYNTAQSRVPGHDTIPESVLSTLPAGVANNIRALQMEEADGY